MESNVIEYIYYILEYVVFNFILFFFFFEKVVLKIILN